MKKFAVILILSLGLRLLAINQSLWLDEAISAKVVKNYGYSQIINNFSPKDFHPPLYYLALKAWTSVFGYSEVSLRMPSVLFSLVTVYVVYLLAGPAAAGLAGLNPLLIYYSQEARMYSMVTMLTTLAIYLMVKKKYLLFNFVAMLCFMTFYGSVFLLAAVALYLLINKKYKELIISNMGIMLAIIVLWPLLKLQMQNSQEMLLQVKNWSLVLGKANIKNLLLIPMKFTSGRISFYPKVIYYIIAGGWALFVFKPLVRWTSPLKKGDLVSVNFYKYLFWMTLLIGTIFSIFTPMMQYFRFLYLIPIMAIIIGKSKNIFVGFLVFSLVYLLTPGMWREDWKSLAKDLNSSVYMIESFGDPVKYYKPEIKIIDIRDVKPTLPSLEKGGKKVEISVIPYGEEIHGVDHQKILYDLGYRKISAKDFRGVSIESWQKI